jgi:hypothetical protein
VAAAGPLHGCGSLGAPQHHPAAMEHAAPWPLPLPQHPVQAMPPSPPQQQQQPSPMQQAQQQLSLPPYNGQHHQLAFSSPAQQHTADYMPDCNAPQPTAQHELQHQPQHLAHLPPLHSQHQAPPTQPPPPPCFNWAAGDAAAGTAHQQAASCGLPAVTTDAAAGTLQAKTVRTDSLGLSVADIQALLWPDFMKQPEVRADHTHLAQEGMSAKLLLPPPPPSCVATPCRVLQHICLAFPMYSFLLSIHRSDLTLCCI